MWEGLGLYPGIRAAVPLGGTQCVSLFWEQILALRGLLSLP